MDFSPPHPADLPTVSSPPPPQHIQHDGPVAGFDDMPPSPSSDESNSPVKLDKRERGKASKPNKTTANTKASTKEEGEEVGKLLKKLMHEMKKEGHKISKDKYKKIFNKAQGKVLEEHRTKAAKKASDGRVAPMRKFLKKRRNKIRELVRKYSLRFR